MATDLGQIDININEPGTTGAPDGPAPARGGMADQAGLMARVLGMNDQRIRAGQEISGFLREPTLRNMGDVLSPESATRQAMSSFGGSIARMMGPQGMVGKALGSMGGIGQKAAAILGPGGAMAKSLLFLGKVALPVAVAIAAIGSAAYVAYQALKKVREVMEGLTDSLRDISPQIALGDALAQITKLKAQLKANAEVGVLLGAQVQAQAKLDAAFMRLKTSLTRNFGPLVVLMTNALTGGVDFLIRAIEGIMQAIGGPGGLISMIGRFVTAVYRHPFMKLFAASNPAMGAMFEGLAKAGDTLDQMGRDVAGIRRNTQPDLTGESNEPFLQDLRFMGVPI